MITNVIHFRVLFCIAIIAVGFVFGSCGNNTSSTNHVNHIYDDGEDDETEDYDNEDYGYASYDEEVGYEDGTYSATVDYYNPNTNYSATYTLDVEVEDGMVIRIYFPSGGWLDEDHIIPDYLDEDGSCTISSYEGNYYEIQID